MRQAEVRECQEQIRKKLNKEDNHDLAWHTLTDYISFDKLTNTSKITSEKDKLAKKQCFSTG